MNTVIYSRFSTDKQNEKSTEDQELICKSRIEAEGWNLVATFRDEGVTGSKPVSNRIGGAKLMEFATEGGFRILLLEGLDRLTRNLGEQEKIVDRLEFMGIRIVGVSDGYDTLDESSKMHRGMRGIINGMQLVDIKKKTHRGMEGQFGRGYATGAAPYGYINVKVNGGSEIHIDPEKAKVVRWIFDQYVSGKSHRKIAAELNERGIPSPRNGKGWGVSAIYGNPQKGSGILNNRLYNGEYIWNKSKWVTNPDTGDRKRFDRPQDEWLFSSREDLRIVSPEVWDAARTRFEKLRVKGGTKGRGGKMKSLLGGLISCGECGGSVISINGHSYGCSNRRDKGVEFCNGANITKKKAEQILLPTIASILRDPIVVDYVHDEAEKALKKIESAEDRDQKTIEQKLRDVDDTIDKLIDAISAVGSSDSLIKRLKLAESEKEKLLKKAAIIAEPTVVLAKSDIKKKYEEKLVELKRVLTDNVSVARSSLSEILGDIVLKKSGLKLLPK